MTKTGLSHKIDLKNILDMHQEVSFAVSTVNLRRFYVKCGCNGEKRKVNIAGVDGYVVYI